MIILVKQSIEKYEKRMQIADKILQGILLIKKKKHGAASVIERSPPAQLVCCIIFGLVAIKCARLRKSRTRLRSGKSSSLSSVCCRVRHTDTTDRNIRGE